MSEDSCEHLLKIAVLEAQLAGMKENILLQAKEYERRLTELNHAHARAADDRTKFVSNELFSAKMSEFVKWQSNIDQWRSKVFGIVLGAGLTGGGLAGALSAAIVRLFGDR